MMAKLEGGATGELPFEEFEYELDGVAEAWRASDEPLGEAEVDEMAVELLEVTGEAELDLFLGGVFKKIGRTAKSGLNVLGRGLKAVAPVALPLLARVAGTALGGPIGGVIAGKLGSLAGQALGGEVAGEAYEDREFETARRYVRFVALSAQRFAPAPGETAESAASRAMSEAARRLVAGSAIGSRLRSRTRGRWTRHGRRLIVYL